MKIGVLDSGIGGIAVLKQLLNCNLDCDYIYFADNLNAPYGGLSKQSLRQRVLELCRLLTDEGAEAVLLLCNTATVAAQSFVQEVLPVPILGIRPELQKGSGKTLILSTMLTAEHLIATEKNKSVTIVGLRSLSTEIEAAAPNFKSLQPYLERLLAPYAEYRTVHIACTHYIHLESIMKNILPNTNFVSGAEPLIAAVTDLVGVNKEHCSEVRFLFSGENKEQLYSEVLGS